MGWMDKLREGAEKASEIAKETLETTRLHALAVGKKRDIEKLYAKLGRSVFDAYDRDQFPEAADAIQAAAAEIRREKTELARIEQQIQDVKGGKESKSEQAAPSDRFADEPVVSYPASVQEDRATPGQALQANEQTGEDAAFPAAPTADPDAAVPPTPASGAAPTIPAPPAIRTETAVVPAAEKSVLEDGQSLGHSEEAPSTPAIPAEPEHKGDRPD